ncbi:hypothetical protein J4H86_06295 [Spiractinospora alimapuensis]|uniref:hypothetical protein n=1 Tax=Spiractinospora alimapuensis TaxID=2820884 RepID=UPI001F157EC9|nr:hypothetical protein [Spiractinospora alimapuensis]QVQ53366.1 hypothetical protein J4H86_06295 [Spiractinospora alimapuensis]
MVRLRRSVVAVLVVLVSACAQEHSETPEVEEPESAPPSDEELALEAYEGMWDVYIEASQEGEAAPSDLERYAMGQAAEHILGTLSERAEAGEVALGRPEISPDVGDVGDTEIVIDDCVDSSEWLRGDAESGEALEDDPTEPLMRRVEATVVYDGLAWRVEEFLIGQRDSC